MGTSLDVFVLVVAAVKRMCVSEIAAHRSIRASLTLAAVNRRIVARTR